MVFFSASEIEINWVCLSFKTFLLVNLHQLKLVAMWETLLRSLLHYGLERTVRKSEIISRKKIDARVGIEPTIRIFKQIPSSLSGARTLLSEPPGHSTLVVSFSQSYSSLLPVPEVTNHLVNGLKIEKFFGLFLC